MLQKLVMALNALSSPILAILVILIGCVYSVISKQYGITGDTAAGIVGAGIGLLTGQVLSTTRQHLADPDVNGRPSSSQTSQVTEKPPAAGTFPQS